MTRAFCAAFLALGIGHPAQATDPIDTGMVIHYAFDGGFMDSSGAGRHPDARNVTLTADRFGRPASACLFDGKTSYLAVQAVPEPGDNDFTWAAWIRADSLSGSSPEGPYLISRCESLGDNPLSPRFVILFSGALRLNSCCYDGFGIDGSVTTSGGMVQVGSWTHVAITSRRIDGTTWGVRKLFVNGQVAASYAVPFYGQTGHSVLQVGADRFFRPGAFFHGAMDEVRVYARELSASEIGRLLTDSAVQWTVSQGGNGHWYQLVRQQSSIDWQSARVAAEARGGHLATIGSIGENDVLFQLTRGRASWANGYGPWLGGFQTGPDWRWVTGEPWTWTNWCPGEPNNDSCSNLAEDALQLGCGSARWNDFPSIPTGCDIDVNGLAVWGYFVEWSADCNNDGIVDYGQILSGALADSDNDGIPNTCECTCDVFRDNAVNGIDLGVLLGQWGEVTQYTVTDFNGDGAVDGSDLGALLAAWGPCPG